MSSGNNRNTFAATAGTLYYDDRTYSAGRWRCYRVPSDFDHSPPRVYCSWTATRTLIICNRGTAGVGLTATDLSNRISRGPRPVIGSGANVFLGSAPAWRAGRVT
ncbi:hypothetical protein ACI65C_012600 [Semiaphis heraclei]